MGGLIPKVAPRNLPELAGQVVRNCWLAETSLEPIKEPLVVEAVDPASQSIYLWRRNNTTEWLSWPVDTNVVQGPIADDQYSRIYFTDGSTLHMKLWDSATSTKVEVDDVSIAPPAAPTITKTALIDFSGKDSGRQAIQMGGWSAPANQAPFAYVGVKFEAGNAIITFKETPEQVRMLGTGAITYWIKLCKETTDGNRTQIPTTLSEASAPELYSTVSDMKDSNVKYGTLQVIDVTVTATEPSRTFQVSPNVTETYPSANVVLTCAIDTGRSSTQFQYYVQTTVNTYGQESPPSALSEMVEWGVADKLTVHSVSNGRLYRSATGDTNADFFFLAENPGSNYVDKIVDAALAEKMPLIENPPSAMSGIVNMPGGFLAAFNKKDVYFSEPWLPYSWPTRYRLTMDYDVVGLAVNGNDLIVLTVGAPYFISGTHPEIMSQTKLPVEQSCVSKRSICFAGGRVCYASPDGLTIVQGGQVAVVTLPYYTRDQWQELNPSTMLGSVHDNRFIGFTGTGGIIFDFAENRSTLGTTDQLATAAYADLVNDQLYLVQGSNITDWRAGVNNLIAVWRCKEFQNVQDVIWSCAKVIADSYTNITFKIYSQGTLFWSVPVTSLTGFRVPKFDRSAQWSIQLETQDRICEVILASNMTLMRGMEAIK